MLTETSGEPFSGAPVSMGSEEIQVRRAPDADAPIIAAARAWALAFEAVQRQEKSAAEGAELALYDAPVDVDALKSAELALYRAVAAELLAPR